MIVAEEDFFDNFVDETPGEWIEAAIDGSIRGNYPGVGYNYSPSRDVFIPPKPFVSWILNEVTYQWESSIPYPKNEEGIYDWDEETMQWIRIDETNLPPQP